MGCEFVQGDGYNAFQCSGSMGEYREMTYKEITGKEPLEPYYEDECPHYNRHEYKNQLTCDKCGMVYNVSSMIWVSTER